MNLEYATVCSGIEAPSVAWSGMGWNARFFSEIEKFPSAVLRHHYKDVPNLGDMTNFKQWESNGHFERPIHILLGGTPCQSFSVAGLRKGMDDPRGNLALTFLGIVDKLRPTWVVWENVAGALSAPGNPVRCLVDGLGELGYGAAFRILDAQHFGVPQRRRRIFLVGYIGGWRGSAAVLFEPKSLPGNFKAGESKGPEVARTLRTRANASHGEDSDNYITVTNGKDWPKQVAPTLDAQFAAKFGLDNQHIDSGCGMFVEDKPIYVADNQARAGIAIDQALTLTAAHEKPFIAHTLRGEGFDASKDGTGRGTPLVPISFHNRQDPISAEGQCLPLGDSDNGLAIAFDAKQSGETTGGDTAPTLRAMTHNGSHANAGGQLAVAFEPGLAKRDGAESRFSEVCPTLRSQAGDNQAAIGGEMGVRRLTPRECERLQGFPDDYTRIPWRGKQAHECPDGPRYKALGNSIATPVLKWIGQRIDLWENLKAEGVI